MNRARHAVLTLLAASLCVAGPVLAAVPPEHVTLQLKWYHQFQFAGYYAAQAKGYYTAAGLNVKIIPGGPNVSPVTAVGGGTVQFGVSDSDVLRHRMNGLPLVALAAIFQHSPYIILSRRDRNIRSPSDLIGKTVMMETGQGDAQLRAMLIQEGIDVRQVHVIPHTWNLADLVVGRVDAVSAYATVEPLQLAAQGVESSYIRAVDYGVDFYGDILFTSAAEVAAHPGRTAAFVRASLEGWAYALDHPEEIADLIAGMDGVAERGGTRETLLVEAEAMRAFILPDVVEIGHMNPGRWQRIADTLVRAGMAPAGVALDDFVYAPEARRDPLAIRWGIGMFAALLFLAAIVFMWNLQVRRQVRRRTQELQAEFLLREQVELELRASETRYRLIMETTSDVVVITAADQRIRYVNKAAMQTFGYRPEELLGQPLLLLQPERLQAAHRAGMQRYLDSGKRSVDWKAMLATARHRDGHEFPVEVSLADLQVSGERLFVGFIRDITERRQAEQQHESLETQLRESQKMQAIGTLAGGVAHDFNNMLGAILGNVQLAREEAADRPLLLQSLDEIRTAGHRARELVRQILAFSRRQPVSRSLCALPPIVGEAARLLRASLPAQVQIEVLGAADVPLVLADPVQVQQVLLNLGTNAAHAMGDGPGRLEFRIEPVMLDAAMARMHPDLAPGRYARVTCSDTGHGMDAVALQRIFEPFFTTKPLGEGTGLGLSVAHGIMSTHHGAIIAHSEPGRGSTFELYFPAAQPVAGEAPPEHALLHPTAAVTHVAGSGQHILCIDDEEALVFLMRRLLERRGYRVSGFADPQQALNALRADPAGFDLVVTDYNMPGLSGLDVARAVRAIRPDLPVAVASGYITEDLQHQAAAIGVSALIFKAQVVEEFCDMVQRLVPSATPTR